MSKPKESNTNAIDEDKITANPHTLPYAHHVGSALVKPIDKGRVKGLAVSAMYDQTEMQLDQIRKQVELLAQQAEEIRNRMKVSELIYQADMGFKPLIGKPYHLYQRDADQPYVLSMIAPEEWGKSAPYQFVASVKMLSDHTWEVLTQNPDFDLSKEADYEEVEE